MTKFKFKAMCHNGMQPFTKFQFWAVHGKVGGLEEVVKCDADLIKQNEWSS